MASYTFSPIPVGATVTVFQFEDGVAYGGSTPYGTTVSSGTADGNGAYVVDLPVSDDYKARFYTGRSYGWAYGRPTDVAAPASPAAGALVGKSTGIFLPSGCLDRWKVARAAAKAGTALVEIPYYGDSTTWGQNVAVTNSTTGAGRSPITQKLRALSIAAGYPDGGTGIQGTRAGTGTSGADNTVLEVSQTGTWIEGFYSPLRQYGYKNSTNTVGDTLTVQMKVPVGGGRIRINHTVGFPANSAAWSYSIDGGAATAVAAQTSTRKTKTRTITGLAAGVHTVAIAITSAGVAAGGDDWTFEVLGNSGLVFQNYGISGSKASGRFDISTNGYAQEAFGLGYFEDAAWSNVNAPYLTANGRAGTPRVIGLAVHSLGINDQQNGSAVFATTSAANDAIALVSASISAFAESIREVCDGVVVLPHLAWAYNPQWAGPFRDAILSTALSYGLAVVDFQAAVGGRTNFSGYGAGVHLNDAGYQAQAQYLWDNVLAAA